jgi:hypothetical protein
MLLAGFLAILIGLPPAFGQQPGAPPAQAAPATAAPAPAPTVETLKILVLQGQNAVNSIRDGIVTMPVVEVHDENDLPVENAEVIFELPATGPGGTFPGGQSMISVRSDLRGQASAAFTLNPDTGRFVIKVSALLRNRTGHITITQTNALEAGLEKSGTRKIKWWKVAVAVGAAGLVVGIVLAVRGGGSSSNTVTVTPGTPTFGTP